MCTSEKLNLKPQINFPTNGFNRKEVGLSEHIKNTLLTIKKISLINSFYLILTTLGCFEVANRVAKSISSTIVS